MGGDASESAAPRTWLRPGDACRSVARVSNRGAWSTAIIVGAAICLAGIVLLLTGWNWGSLVALVGVVIAVVGAQGYNRGRRGRRAPGDDETDSDPAD